MRGAPWEGLFYGFVLEVLIAFGALVMALRTDDFLTRAIAWALVVVLGLAAVRTVRRALRQEEHRGDRPVGRWWYGG